MNSSTKNLHNGLTRGTFLTGLVWVIIFVAILALFTGSANGETADNGKIPIDSGSVVIESGKTYTISGVEELFNFVGIVNGSRDMEICKGATIELTCDIVINSGIFGADEAAGQYMERNPLYNGQPVTSVTESGIKPWKSMKGFGGGSFAGTFDGQGHTVSGIFVDDSGGIGEGFFGDCRGAVIKNLNIANSYIRSRHCGAIVGMMNGGTISNCKTSAIIIGWNAAGGIAGNAQGITDAAGVKHPLLIENCVNEGQVLNGSSKGFTNNLTFYDHGGIAGVVNSGTVTGCINKGRVAGQNRVGAIAGTINGETVTVTGCTNTGTSADKNNNQKLIGYNSKIKDCETVITTPRIKDENGIDINKRGATVTFDEKAMTAAGTYFEYSDDGSYIYVEKTGALVIQVVPESDYQITSVTGTNCTVEKTGEYQYKLWGFTGESRITVLCKGIDHKYTLEIINRKGGYADILPPNDLSIGAETGYYLADVTVNGKSLGAVKSLRIQEGDDIKVYFAKTGQTWQETLAAGGNTGTDTGEEKPLTDAQKAAIKTGIQATTIKAQSVKVVGGVIRVVWKKSKGYKVDYYQIFRSTKKSSGYGIKPIYTTKTGKATYYDNTKSVKKGTRYYYKLRGVRVIDGKKVYTKWSNKVYGIGGWV